jgi:hypothetical protein
MFSSLARTIGTATLAVILGAGLTANVTAQGKDSGFLKDYSQLKTEKDPLGFQRRIWASPKLTREAYQKVLVERITFYPAPQSSEKVSTGTLNDIRDYGEAAIRKAIASVVPLADAPGSGVLRVRIAVTAVAVESAQLKPYQLIPVALVLTAATEAAGEGRRDVKLAVETEITDSVSGEPLARVVRDAQGVRLKSNEALTLEVAKPQIDRWAEAARESLAARLKPAGR